MVKPINAISIHFPDWYDDRGEWEAESKGWLQGVSVELPDGRVYPVFFYDPIRLQQDLSEDPTARRYIAEAGLIVIPEITKTAIQHAVESLVQEGFFEQFRPMNPRADLRIAV